MSVVARKPDLAETHLSTVVGVAGQINQQDFYISQLIHHIEDLDTSSRTQKTLPSNVNSSIYLTSCSSSKYTSVQSQAHTAQFRMIHQHPSANILVTSRERHRSSTKHHQGQGQATGSSQPRLKATPIHVANTASSRVTSNRKMRAKTFYCWGSIQDGESGSSAGASRLNGCSPQEDFNSDNSDLSDQEKGGSQAQVWATPAVPLLLRPEPFDLDPDCHLSVPQAPPLYVEVLPTSLNVLDPTQSLPTASLSGHRQTLQSLCGLPEHLMFAFQNRLSEMEALQAATVQRERTKTGRCRTSTAVSLTKSPSRLRKPEIPGLKSEFAATRGYGNIVSGLTKLCLSRDSGTRQSVRTGAVYKQNRVKLGTRPHLVFKKPCTSSTKLNGTENRTQGQSLGNGSTPTSTSCTKVRKAKANKKHNFSSKAKDLAKAS